MIYYTRFFNKYKSTDKMLFVEYSHNIITWDVVEHILKPECAYPIFTFTVKIFERSMATLWLKKQKCAITVTFDGYFYCAGSYNYLIDRYITKSTDINNLTLTDEEINKLITKEAILKVLDDTIVNLEETIHEEIIKSLTTKTPILIKIKHFRW